MRVLVTGHDGYLGTRLTPLLRQAGHRLRGIDTGFFADRALGRLPSPVPSRTIDIRDVEAGDLQDVEAVVHLAGLSNDPLGDRDPRVTADVNHHAATRLARLARDAGVRRFVFASTCSVYGAGPAGEQLTEDGPVAPLTPYAAAKLAAERDLLALADDRFVPVVLRPGTVFGWSPRLRADLVVNNLVGWALTTGQVRLRSDGSSWRPLVHVDDVAAVLAAAVDAPLDPVVLNVVGPDGDVRIREVADVVAAATGAAVVVAPDAPADPRTYRVDGTRLLETLPSAAPRRGLAHGVAELVDRYRRHGFTADDLHVGLRRNPRIDRLVAEGRLDPDLRWRTPTRAA